MKRLHSLYLVTSIIALAILVIYSQNHSTRVPDKTLQIVQIGIADSEDFQQVQTSLEGFLGSCKNDIAIPVAIRRIAVKNADEYLIKRNTLMLSKNAPDIIVTGGLPLEDLGKLGVLLPLDHQLSNATQLKSAFKGQYTLVAGYHLQSFAVNKHLLADLNLSPPTPNWRSKDLVTFIETVKSKRPGVPLFLTKALYEIYFDAYFSDYITQLRQQKARAVDLNSPDFMTPLNSMKQALRAHFDLSSVPSHSSRQRMIFDEKSAEYQTYMNGAMSSLSSGMAVIPSLNAMNTATLAKVYEANPNLIILPAGKTIETFKFAINKHAPHLSDAKQFLNAVIGWKAQYSYSIYNKTIRYAQVNSDNEDRLNAYGDFFAKDTNAVTIRRQVLQQLDRGVYTDKSEISPTERILKEELMKTTFDLIFDDHLSDPQNMKKELQIATNRIQLMLKE